MERRISKRRRLLRNVVLHTDSNRLLTGKMRDLSFTGMSLRLPASRDLGPGQHVRVAFMVGARLQVARARVVRSSPAGLALRFGGDEPQLREAIEDLFLRQDAVHCSRAA